jgi:FkbM family methyltransferase
LLLKVQRLGCLNFKGVRILPPPTLFYIPYAFLRLMTKWARRPQWLSSFEGYVKTRLLRGLRVRTRYLGFEVSMTLEGLVDLSPVVFSQAYEFAEKELISFIKPEVAIDVGAHLGSFTLLLAKYAKVVVAVEPDPRAVRMLASNISANRLSNVIVFPYACSSSDDRELSLKLKRGGTSSIVQSPDGDVTVRAIKVDTIVEALRLEKVSFLKVDVEGHELEVLRGAQNTLSKYRPILLVELWPENAREAEIFLQKLRYSLARVLTRHAKGRLAPYHPAVNCLYLPQELPFNQLKGPRVIYLSAVNEIEQGVSKPPCT